MAEALFPTVPNPNQVQRGLTRAPTPPGAAVLRDWEFDFILDDLTTHAGRPQRRDHTAAADRRAALHRQPDG